MTRRITNKKLDQIEARIDRARRTLLNAKVDLESLHRGDTRAADAFRVKVLASASLSCQGAVDQTERAMESVRSAHRPETTK